MDWELIVGIGVVAAVIAVFAWLGWRKPAETPVFEPSERKREELQDFLNEPTPLPEKAPDVLVQPDIPVWRDKPVKKAKAIPQKAKPKIKAKRRAF